MIKYILILWILIDLNAPGWTYVLLACEFTFRIAEAIDNKD